MSETAKYSVFFDNGECRHNADDQEEFADALGQIVAPAAVRWPNCTPVAWAPAWPGGGKSSHQIREESIAAGRVINVEWVSSEEKADEQKFCDRLAQYAADDLAMDELADAMEVGAAAQMGLRDSHCAMRDSDTNPKPALTWNTKTEFNQSPGFVVQRFDADDLMPAAPTGHPLQKLGDTSNPLHGSAMLKKG